MTEGKKFDPNSSEFQQMFTAINMRMLETLGQLSKEAKDQHLFMTAALAAISDNLATLVASVDTEGGLDAFTDKVVTMLRQKIKSHAAMRAQWEKSLEGK